MRRSFGTRRLVGEQWEKDVWLAREYPGEVWLVKAFIPNGPFSLLNVSALVVDEDEEVIDLSGEDEGVGDMFVSHALGVYS
jgi:hypothetical protein